MSSEKTSLYLVPTPIGNMGDITFRALDILKQVDTILAEDTRKSGILLKHYDIKKSLTSFHIFNEHKRLSGLLERMKSGETMALISDAGTPGISDPGFLLVRACLGQQIKIECLPGSTAFLPALIKSGFPTDRFVFEGFLPHKKVKQTMLKNLAIEERTIILYESPHRLEKTLNQMPDLDREVIALRHFEELSSAETAEVLGIEPAAASKRYVRALSRLKELLVDFESKP